MPFMLFMPRCLFFSIYIYIHMMSILSKAVIPSKISACVYRRLYHSFYHVNPPILDSSTFESKILSKAYKDYVPTLGFKSKAIENAANDLGYNGNTIGAIFNFATPSKDLTMELVLYHLKYTRQQILDLRPEANALSNETEKVRYLVQQRLLMNSPIIQHYHEALGRMILPSNFVNSLEELHNLSDDITFYGGDRSNDFAWYSKRFALSGLFIQSELFMLKDTSEGFKNTLEFVNNRLSEIETTGYVYNSIEEWLVFNAYSFVNLIKSQLTRG